VRAQFDLIKEYDKWTNNYQGYFKTNAQDFYWKDPYEAITPTSFAVFYRTIRDWYDYVNTHVNRWDRRLQILEFRKTGKISSFWSSPVGDFTGRLFPTRSGLTMEKPPPYYYLFTERDRRAYIRFEAGLFGKRIRRCINAGAVIYLITLVAQFTARRNGMKYMIPSVFRNPFIGLPTAIVTCFPFYFFTYRPYDCTYAMDDVLHVTGCFVAAKLRLIADDVMYPATEGHNRFYLRSLPRDRWDKLVWSVDDDVLALKGPPFDWAKKENFIEPSFWQLRSWDKIRVIKAKMKHFFGYNFYEIEDLMQELRQTYFKTTYTEDGLLINTNTS